jgi:acylphosphatase
MRWWIRARALELGLVGWARNLDDGRVEVVAEGPEPAVRTLLDMLGTTPISGRPGHVVGVVERFAAATGPGESGDSGFTER